ncbi:MAG: hypothetical protein AB7K04_01875 [Pseudorhodoplanes sp.]
MDGKVPPSGIDGIDAAVASLEVTDTLIAFLRTTLRLYKAVTRRGEKWSDRALASTIVSCRAVPQGVDFDQETLRRFLKNDGQVHRADFIRAIAAFLLSEKWLTPADLAAHDKDVELRTAVALQSFVPALPAAKAAEFHQELSGRYVRYAIAAGRILKIDLTITAVPDAPVLRVSQRERQYAAVAAEDILTEAATLTPESNREIERLLGSHATEMGAPQYALGFGIAGPDLIACLVKDELHRRVTAYLVDSVAWDDDEAHVASMNAVRYSGWGDRPDRTEARFAMCRIPFETESAGPPRGIYEPQESTDAPR